MPIPINFPDDDDVIREEVARFRALPPAEQIRSVRNFLTGGNRLARRSPKIDAIRAAQCEEELAHSDSIREFIRRHA